MTEPDSDRQFQPHPGVIFRDVGGEAVLLNLTTEEYYSLDEVGAQMWHRLIEATSITSAYDALLADYEIDPQTLRTDLTDFIERLLTAQLAQVVEINDG